MKHHVPLSLLTLVLVSACAPKAIVLGQPNQGSRTQSPQETVANNTSNPSLDLPPSGETLDLLDPKGLTTLPKDQDMRPTATSEDQGPVIATPPSGE